MFLLNSKNEISTDVYYKDTSTQDYLLYDSAHSESGKKNVSYNLARKIIVFITDPEKVKLRLNGLKTWLKNNKYPDHIISNAFYNAKLPFVTSFHEDTDNKIIMKTNKRIIENTPSDYIKKKKKKINIFLSQIQPKNLLRLLSNSSISRNPSLPKGVLKPNDKRWKIYRLYIIECSEFELSYINRNILSLIAAETLYII